MIWGLCGYSGSGKDSAADYLVKHHDFTRVAFADKLREFAYEINPKIRYGEPKIRYGEHTHTLRYLVDEYGWDIAKREFIEIREFLQAVGHAARESFGDSFWINQVFTTENLSNDRLVITDVRYQNEADYITSLDGFIVRIEREGVGPVNNHITEKPLPFDYVVKNPSNNLPGFYHNLDDLVKNITSLII